MPALCDKVMEIIDEETIMHFAEGRSIPDGMLMKRADLLLG